MLFGIIKITFDKENHSQHSPSIEMSSHPPYEGRHLRTASKYGARHIKIDRYIGNTRE